MISRDVLERTVPEVVPAAGRAARPAAPDTRTQILDVAEEMLRSRSFNAFSYQDISERVGIRKASIHYHFPSKEDLGIALLERFQERAGIWARRLNSRVPNPAEKLDAYFALTEAILEEELRICVYGVLGAEYNSLPPRMQEVFRGLQQNQHEWLIRVFEKGREQGFFHAEGTPAEQAALVAASVQGALQVARTTGDPENFHGVVRQLRRAIYRTAEAAAG